MKKMLLMLLICSTAIFAVDRLWTNGSGDQDFVNYLNWYDLASDFVFTATDRPIINLAGTDAAILNADVICENLYIGAANNTTGQLDITGGTNSFISAQIGYSAGSNAILNISGGDTSFSGYLTIANNGSATAQLTITDGILRANRTTGAQNVGAVSDYYMSGGEFIVDTYGNIGLHGQGTFTMTGGKASFGSSMKLGSSNKLSSGILTMSGDAEFSVGSFTNVGDTGYGAIYMNGGTLNLDRVTFGNLPDPNAQGYLYLTDGEVNINQYCTVANGGTGVVEVSGGVLNSNRLLLGQSNNSGYLSEGYLTVTGGEVNLDDYLEIGRDGSGWLTLVGDSSKVSCSDFWISGLGTAEFVLNGSAGVGSGITAFTQADLSGEEPVLYDARFLLREGAQIDTSFAVGTDVAGDYVLIASSSPAEFLPASETDSSLATPLPTGDVTDFLTADAQTAGWSATLYQAGSGSAFVATSPITAAKAAWSSAGSSDIAVIDDDSIVLSSAKTANGAVVADAASATLEAAAGGSGNFVNFTVAENLGSTGTVNVTGGSITVDSVAYIGKQGDAALNVTSGSFNAANLIAATGDEALADIKISGDAVFGIDSVLALSAGSKLTVSGYQTDTNVGNLSLAEGANITFEVDENHGVGNGLVVAGNAVLGGTISMKPIGDRVDATYTVIRALGEIIVENEEMLDTVFSTYQIVENGEYQELQVEFFTPDDCEQVISTGFGIYGDINEDCYVDIADFAIIASKWLTCNDPTNPDCDLQL